MRRWLVLLVLLGAALGQKVTVIGPWSGAEADQFLPVLKAFEEKTGIAVDYRVYRAEDLAQILPAQFAAKKTIGDVIFTAWGWWVEKNADHLADLSALAAGVPFITPPIEAGDKVVALPYVMWVKPGFWYRKSFFKAHGLTPPGSWEEFVALLEKIEGVPGVKNAIASGDGVGWPLSDVTEHFLATFGGPELNLDLIAGKERWQSERVRRVFAEYLVPLLKKRHFSDPIEWTQAKDLWWNGDYGLYFMGNWLLGMVPEPTDLGVFPLPGAKAVVAGTDYMFVPRYTRNIDAAMKLVAFLVSKEGVELRVKQGGKLSMRADVGPEAYPPAERTLAAAIQGLKTIPDLDDSIGGAWQQAFWDQLKLLWVRPDALDEVLKVLDEKRR